MQKISDRRTKVQFFWYSAGARVLELAVGKAQFFCGGHKEIALGAIASIRVIVADAPAGPIGRAPWQGFRVAKSRRSCQFFNSQTCYWPSKFVPFAVISANRRVRIWNRGTPCFFSLLIIWQLNLFVISSNSFLNSNTIRWCSLQHIFNQMLSLNSHENYWHCRNLFPLHVTL